MSRGGSTDVELLGGHCPPFVGTGEFVPYHEFVWTRRAIEKVMDNGLDVVDVEQVVLMAKGVPLESRSSGRPMYTGLTRSKELVAVVFEELDSTRLPIITAFRNGER